MANTININRFQRTQNGAASILTNTGKCYHITLISTPKHLHLLPIIQHIDFNMLLTTGTFIKGRGH